MAITTMINPIVNKSHKKYFKLKKLKEKNHLKTKSSYLLSK